MVGDGGNYDGKFSLRLLNFFLYRFLFMWLGNLYSGYQFSSVELLLVVQREVIYGRWQVEEMAKIMTDFPLVSFNFDDLCLVWVMNFFCINLCSGFHLGLLQDVWIPGEPWKLWLMVIANLVFSPRSKFFLVPLLMSNMAIWFGKICYTILFCWKLWLI